MMMAPRWKGKAAEAKAIAKPMSTIISQLQYSLLESNSRGLLLGSSVRLAANTNQAELLTQTCFGYPTSIIEKDNQWFQLSLEEAFYLSNVLKCIKLIGGNNIVKTNEEVWRCMISQKTIFPITFKAYSHLRLKNWVLRSGYQFGVDFVAYRHHPSLVHSEYAVIVKSEEDEETNGRLKVWSDFHCTLRLCGGVAKTLLVLYVEKNCDCGASSPSSLENYSVEERIVTRWIPEEIRENRSMDHREVLEPRT